MSNYILFVFEGEVREKQIFESLKRYFFNEGIRSILISAYCSNIYSLYHKLDNDPDLELFPLLKNNPRNSHLSGISRDDVSETYLFFDHDGHDTAASHKKLDTMLYLFSEETDHGKLYISYPMVEAIKHLNDSTPFKDVVFQIHAGVSYKESVAKSGAPHYRNIPFLSHARWKKIVAEHCKKLNFLMTNEFEFPTSLTSQPAILSIQKVKHIDTKNEVAVLSGFPIFIIDYYGCHKTAEMICTEIVIT